METNLVDRIKMVQLLPVDGLRARSAFAKSKTSDPSAKGLKRVFRELKRDLPRALDHDAFGSIFIRYDSEAPNFMQAMLTGGPYSPYCHGLFLFDICCGNDYPIKNCQVLHTTKNANTFKLRHSPGGFSPNLHSSSGKVCLSLLGTWSGIGWSPNKSNVYQVLSTLLRDVLGVENPYYNEPNYGFWEGTAPNKGHSDKVVECNEIIREKTIELAMIAPMKNPPKGFEDVVKLHFQFRQTAIENCVRTWLNDAHNRLKSLERLPCNMPKIKRMQRHAEKLEALYAKLMKALIENMGYPNFQRAINRKLSNMQYAKTSLDILKNKLGTMFNTCLSEKKVIRLERGGIVFTAKRKLIDTFQSNANKDLEWKSNHNGSKDRLEKAFSEINAIQNTVEQQKAIYSCVYDIVDRIKETIGNESLHKQKDTNPFAILQDATDTNDESEDLFDLSKVVIEEDDEGEKFGIAPTTEAH